MESCTFNTTHTIIQAYNHTILKPYPYNYVPNKSCTYSDTDVHGQSNDDCVRRFAEAVGKPSPERREKNDIITLITFTFLNYQHQINQASTYNHTDTIIQTCSYHHTIIHAKSYSHTHKYNPAHISTTHRHTTIQSYTYNHAIIHAQSLNQNKYSSIFLMVGSRSLRLPHFSLIVAFLVSAPITRAPDRHF